MPLRHSNKHQSRLQGETSIAAASMAEATSLVLVQYTPPPPTALEAQPSPPLLSPSQDPCLASPREKPGESEGVGLGQAHDGNEQAPEVR
jgi:hypothetical protein